MSSAAPVVSMQRHRSPLIRLMLWDLTLAWRERLTWVVLGVLIAAFGLAVLSGARTAADQRAVIAQAQATAAEAEAELRDALASGDASAQAPDRLRTAVILPPAPLAALVNGRTRLEPATSETNAFGQAHRLFRDYQVDNPWALKLGSFDVALVLVHLVPLLIVALGASAVSADRASGLDRLLSVHAASSGIVLTSRILARAVLIGVPVLGLTAVAGLLTAAPADRLLALLLLSGLAMAAWWALVALLAARIRTAHGVALALLMLWAGLSIVVPATLATLIQAASPPPSRITWITAARAAEIAALNQSDVLVGRFMTDHPELEPGGVDIPARTRARLVVAREVDSAIAPIAAEFAAARERQMRLAGMAQLLSPALALEQALTATAGTGVARFGAFQMQAHGHARSWQDQVGDMIMAGQPVTPARLDALPGFAFREPGWLGSAAGGAGVLLLWAGLALWLARRATPRAGRD